jgi:hypothetical protein
MHNKSRASVVLSLAAVASVPLALSLAVPARAANVSWSSPASGSWVFATNWSTGTVPTSADAVSIAAPGGPYTVTAGAMVNNTASTGTLSVTQGKGGTRTLNAHVLNTGTLSIGPGATLTLNGSLSTTTPLDL